MAKVKNYSVTIGYKAVFEVFVKAENKEQAEKDALNHFTNQRNKMGRKIELQDDTYKVDGVLDMDNTWQL